MFSNLYFSGVNLRYCLLFLLIPLFTTAQNLSWSKAFNGTGGTGLDIITDGSGNVYTTGSFFGTVDFDPGPGVFNLTQPSGSGIFISKLNAAGNLVWVKQFVSGNIKPYAIELDAAGNVYTAGFFQFTADFDPGPGVYSLSVPQNMGSHGFVSKLDANGNFLWVSRFGGDNNSYLSIFDIKIDASENILITGHFNGNADFDPGPGTSNLNSAGLDDSYVVKINPAGNLIWVRQFQGVSFASSRGVSVDANGNVYTTGYCNGSVDFDPGPGTYILSGIQSIYFSKLDAAGSFLWAKRLDGGTQTLSNSIEVDVAGNAFVTGYFRGSQDFDPGPAVIPLTSAGEIDLFLLKLDGDGQLLWTKQTGGVQADEGKRLFLDASNNIYLTGYFQATVDFDPGPASATATAVGTYDIFVSKFTSNGTLLWSRQAGNSAFDMGLAVAADTQGGVYTTGYFNETVDFDPGPGVFNLSSSASENPFVWKLSRCTNSSSSTLTVTTCSPYTLNNQVYPASGTYTQIISNAAGCDSTITLQLTVGGTLAIATATACDSYTWEGQTLTVSGTYFVNYIGAGGCDSTHRLFLTIKNSKQKDLNISICEGQNYQGYTSSGTYTNVFTGANGCDSTRTLHLTIRPKKASLLNVTICQGESYQGYQNTGIYTDLYPASNGCDSVRTLHLTVNPKKQTSRNISICVGASYWAGGSLQTLPGTYSDTLQTILGCDSIVTIQLTVNALPTPQLGPDRSICAESNALLSPGQFASYKWHDQSNGSTFNATAMGTYWVKVTDANACEQTDTVRILSILPLPSGFLKEADSLCSYEKLRLQSQTFFPNYQWSTGSTQNFIDIQTPGWYKLLVTNDKGCKGSDSILVSLKSCPSGIYFPTVFTPNNDGKNDKFKALVHGRTLSFTLQVFERGGGLVFQSNNPTAGWDGTLRGKAFPTGVLVWQCFYQLDGEKPGYQKGTVTLLR